ncbi:hypothetical protein VA603_00635, partial [Stenotrophomonas sp. MH1]|nr:hypothetical protein [Stenotrophomonas sp. MH1]
QIAVLHWLSGDRRAALATCRNVVRDAIAALDGAAGLSARTEAATAAHAAVLAQRLGDHAPARQLIARLDTAPQLAAMQPVSGFLQVLRAREALAAGKNTQALEGLLSLHGQHESFQLRVALMEAYATQGNADAALRQAQWLTSNRGWAYAEFGGCGWCGQSLNVADANLARLRRIELLDQLGRRVEARSELERFDGDWKTRALPDYLRTRREALLSTFN